MISSGRKYRFIFVDGVTSEPYFEDVELTLEDIIVDKEEGKDYEYLYAIQDVIDSVLDLRFGDSISLSPDRNYDGKKPSSPKGILTRIA